MQVILSKLANLFGPYLPSLLGAVVILIVGWFVALIVSSLVRKGVQRAGIGPRIGKLIYGDTGGAQPNAERLAGKAVFYLIMLFVLVAFFQALGLTIASNPLGQFLTKVFGYATQILGAIVLLLIGWIVATALRFVVTRVMTTGLASERLSALFATKMEGGNVSLAQTLGQVVYWLILLLFLPAVLGALGLDGILVPVQGMINKMLGALPNIFAATLLLMISWLVARILQRLISNILAGIGFNNILAKLGIDYVVGAPQPAEVVGHLITVAIMLFAVIEASRLLGFEALAGLVVQLTVLFGHVLLGAVVFAIGLYLANLAYGLVQRTARSNASLLANAARVSILALVAAMALREMGIASEIINLAFGLLIGAVAVAVALAFGLGGRETAGKIVAEWRHKVSGSHQTGE